MTPKARLHIYPHSGPTESAYIVGEPAALLHLSEALRKAAIGAVGLEVINSYTSDGHEYQIVISSDVQETEWQSTVPSYQQDSTAENFSSIKIYHEVAGK